MTAPRRGRWFRQPLRPLPTDEPAVRALKLIAVVLILCCAAAAFQLAVALGFRF